jgi:hypothetical protein
LAAYLETALKDPPQLLGLGVAGILDLQIAPLRDDLLGREGPLCVPPSRVSPPLLNLGNLVGEKAVLQRRVHGRIYHVVGSHRARLGSEETVERSGKLKIAADSKATDV